MYVQRVNFLSQLEAIRSAFGKGKERTNRETDTYINYTMIFV